MPDLGPGSVVPAKRGASPAAQGRHERRERDSNPRGRVNALRHFECRALGRTMRSLRCRDCNVAKMTEWRG